MSFIYNYVYTQGTENNIDLVLKIPINSKKTFDSWLIDFLIVKRQSDKAWPHPRKKSWKKKKNVHRLKLILQVGDILLLLLLLFCVQKNQNNIVVYISYCIKVEKYIKYLKEEENKEGVLTKR